MQPAHVRQGWFQHTAARRRLPKPVMLALFWISVSTHSRPKAAAPPRQRRPVRWFVSTHSRPKAAAEAGNAFYRAIQFQHTAARRRLPTSALMAARMRSFQHTAARRRLLQFVARPGADGSFNTQPPEGGCGVFRHAASVRRVSTHSRPKAAALTRLIKRLTQRLFQHTAARRRLPAGRRLTVPAERFQHTAARRRLRWRKQI